MGCQGCLQCTLKLLNFMVTLVGAYMVLYGLWMLHEWHSELPPPAPPGPPVPPVPVPAPAPAVPVPVPAPSAPVPAPAPAVPAAVPAPSVPEPSPSVPVPAPAIPVPVPAPSVPVPVPSLPPPSSPAPVPSPTPSPNLPPDVAPVPAPSSEPSSGPSSVPGPMSDGPLLPISNGRDSYNLWFAAAAGRRPFLVMTTGVARNVRLPKLPVPWFIYAFLGAGIITCLVTCTGHIAAETSHGFCLSCYTCLQVLLLIAQFALAGYLFFDHHWREDIPDDPTGELDKVKAFVQDNLNLCKWVALAVVGLEILGLFFAMILRAVAANARRTGYDSDDDYLAPRSNARQPLLNRQVNPSNPATAPGSTADNRPVRNDAWSTRMREKYGLDTSEFPKNPSELRRFAQQNTAPPPEEKQSCCTVM